MAKTGRFSYDGLFSKDMPASPPSPFPKAKYDFAVAYPDPDTIPLDGLVDSLKTALDREGRDLAYYPDAAGLLSLRQLVAGKLARDRGMTVDAEHVVMTSGSSEAIGMLIQALTDPGDTVLTEEYVYLGTLRQLRRYGVNVVGVACDDGGIVPQALEETLAALRGQDRAVKFLYTIPTFQNPLGWTMSLERRKALLEITGDHGVPVFEDDCYVDLRFEGEDVASFHSMDDTGRVIYVGSFSKILAPGMRMGYMVAPPEVLHRALSGRSGGGPSQFSALAIEEYLKHNMYSHIAQENEALRTKRDAMLASLGESFGSSAKWNAPQGGLYVWLRLPEGSDLAAVQAQALAEGVAYYNGSQFSPEGKGVNCARLCFGHPSAETVYDGVAELARVLDRHGVLGG